MEGLPQYPCLARRVPRQRTCVWERAVMCCWCLEETVVLLEVNWRSGSRNVGLTSMCNRCGKDKCYRRSDRKGGCAMSMSTVVVYENGTRRCERARMRCWSRGKEQRAEESGVGMGDWPQHWPQLLPSSPIIRIWKRSIYYGAKSPLLLVVGLPGDRLRRFWFKSDLLCNNCDGIG